MAQSDPVTPYRGSAPYKDTAQDRALFFGRSKELEELVSLIAAAQLVTLFSRSGLGKSSLINAALLPRLRDDGYLPILTRLTWVTAGAPDSQAGQINGNVAANFLRQVMEQLERIGASQDIEITYDKNARELWRFFASLRCLRRRQRGKPKEIRPVVVIDQFEELFSRLRARCSP